MSAGFDAAPGHPPTLGGYSVSPACFASMTSSLLLLAEGKVVSRKHFLTELGMLST